MRTSKANFYVTESGAFRNRVLYFRHDDWQMLCKPLVEKLCGDTFQKLSQVGLGYSQVGGTEMTNIADRRERDSSPTQTGLFFRTPFAKRDWCTPDCKFTKEEGR